MIGSHLLHYRILSLLGSGGMGEVFLAFDEKLGREVAIKVLPRTADEEGERLRQEARALAALNHPNIVTVYAVEEADGRPFLVMERIDGESLRSRMQLGGLPVAEFFAIALPLTAAIAAAHQRGVSHRDLKPGNILITPEGNLKVLDFGLACGDGEPEGDSEAVVGTLPYLAPEVIEKKSIDPRADVFSLGILLHELATGWRPFQGDNVAGLMIAIVCNRREPASYERSLPPGLPALIDRCLASQPAQRFADAGELHRELCNLQEPLPTQRAAERSGRARFARLATYLLLGALVVASWLLLLHRAGSPAAAVKSASAAAPPPPTTNLEAYHAYVRGRDEAWLIINLKQAEEAELYLERALELDPRFVLAWCELAFTHAQVFHFGLDHSSARAAKAAAALERARALDRDAAEVHRAAGFVYYWTRRDYDNALVELGKAIALDPGDARSREGRAFIERRRGRMEEAMAEMRRVVELNPRDGRAWRELGVTATYLRRYDEALRAFEQAIQLSPDPMVAYLSQTRVYWLRGEFAAARRKLSSRPPIAQDLPHFHAFWQEVYEGRLDAALAELDQVKSPVFSWSTVYTPVASLRALALGWQGKNQAATAQYQASLEEIDRLLRRELEDPRLHALRAQALIGLGRQEEARGELSRALSLAQGGDWIAASEVQFEASVAWVALGDFELALASLEKQLAEPSNLISPPLLARDPRFARLHPDPRFTRLTQERSGG